MAYNWAKLLTYHHIDSVDYWRVYIDEIVTMVWRPYMGLGPRAKDEEQLPYMISPCFVFGWWAYLVE